MNLFSRVIAWVRGPEPVVPPPSPTFVPDIERMIPWEDQDAQKIESFFASPTGRRLLLRMGCTEQRLKHRACFDEQNATPFRAGYAGGYAAARTWLVSISVKVPPQEDPDEPFEDADLDEREHRNG